MTVKQVNAFMRRHKYVRRVFIVVTMFPFMAIAAAYDIVAGTFAAWVDESKDAINEAKAIVRGCW